MNCIKCQRPLGAGSRFCGACGTPAGDSASVPFVVAAGAGAAAAHLELPGAAAPNAPSSVHAPGLLARVKGMLVGPRAEWVLVAGESTPVSSLIVGYVAPLAGFAALVNFLRMAVIGVHLPFGGPVRSPMPAALMGAAYGVGAGVVGILLVSLIVHLLAPTFGGERNGRRALQVAGYSLTPALVGTVFGLLPFLGTLLGLLAGVYGIYVLYLGLPIVMRSRADKAGGYTAAVVICTILLGIVAATAGITTGLGRAGAASALKNLAPQTQEERRQATANSVADVIGGALGTDDKGKSGIASAISNLAKAGEQAGTNAATSTASSGEAAAPKADPAGSVAAVGGLVSALGGALGGATHHDPIDYHKLETLLPASVPGLSRADVHGEANQAMGIARTSAVAEYRGGKGATVLISITDATGVSALAGIASSFGDVTSESDTGYEKTVTIAGHPVHAKYDSAAKHGELSAIVAGRFGVDVTGENVSMEALQKAMGQIDFAGLDAMRDAGASPR